MSELNPLAQQLAQVIEPWEDVPATDEAGSMTVTATSGTTVDLNMRRPKEPEADHLYAWPTQHVHTHEGAGNPPESRENFAVQFLYVVDREGEEPQLAARRDVSDALDARADLYVSRIRDNFATAEARSAAPWQHLQATVQHDTAVTFGVRGVGLLVTGYRYS